ncbi:MAG: NAD-dependent protein deacetylase [Trueperaceae bacterium]|nr:NAD-dependent protein deacetylase [Trueperaceae bacterium]
MYNLKTTRDGVHPTALGSDLMRLIDLLRDRQVLVLGGAGMSTDSGIPDYRGATSSKKPRNPIRYQQFVKSAVFRQRYWARSFRGWSFVYRARPNPGHEALARLEMTGGVGGILTQNVDGLHQAAGSRNVLELHGSLAAVRCLDCRAVTSRRDLQSRMAEHNPSFADEIVAIAPDGDAELSDEVIARFVVPSCASCGGMLKPDVVLFGENVPKRRVERAWSMLARADVLLVLGSSLTVYSGYRFVARAVQDGKPVAILNLGPTRGDKDATLKLDVPLGEVLPALVDALH